MLLSEVEFLLLHLFIIMVFFTLLLDFLFGIFFFFCLALQAKVGTNQIITTKKLNGKK